LRQKRAKSIKRVGLGGRLVGSPAKYAGKTDGDAGLVTVRPVQTLEGQLEDELGLDGAHRAELLDHVVSDEGIDAADFLVGQPRVSLGDGHERAGGPVPDAERVVGVEASSLATAALGEQEHGVDC